MHIHRHALGTALFILVASMLALAPGCGSSLRAFMPRTSAPLDTRPAGMSRVVFVGRCAASRVRVVDGDGRFVGDCASDLWWVTDVAPGEHAFVGWTRGERPAYLAASLRPDRTYVIYVHVSTETRRPRAVLEALRPGHEDWRHLSWWMRPDLRVAPDLERGQEALDLAFDDVLHRIDAGASSWSALREPERRRHSLRTHDGAL